MYGYLNEINLHVYNYLSEYMYILLSNACTKYSISRPLNVFGVILVDMSFRGFPN